MRLTQKIGLAIAVASTMTAANAARDTIQIAGSSTVLPFASIVAEDCNKAGVNKIQEIKIGYDGIVFASNSNKAAFKLKPYHVFAALAEKMPAKGKLIANPYTRWNQIDKALPNEPITLVIPASNHGTREVFQEKMVTAGCEAYTYFKNLDKDAREKACSTFRKDGRVVEIAGDYTETLARLKTSPSAVGVFGLSFYDQNRDRLRVATVNGVTPSEATVISGKYPVSRPLYFYVKGEHLQAIKGLPQYVEFFVSPKVSGPNSKLVNAGLIPLSSSERSKILADFKAGKTVK